MKLTKKTIVALLMVSIAPLSGMENEKNNIISDAELLAQKKAFGLELKKREEVEFELIFYPKGSNIKIDVKKLNEELGFSHEVVCRFGHIFRIPAGMDEKFIHKTLIPEDRFFEPEVQFDLSH